MVLLAGVYIEMGKPRGSKGYVDLSDYCCIEDGADFVLIPVDRCRGCHLVRWEQLLVGHQYQGRCSLGSGCQIADLVDIVRLV